MALLFIADLHLSTAQPAITAGFLHFLQHEAREAEALYILGDLFDAWVGDDDPDPLKQTVAEALRQLQQHGVDLFFIHGNRDFLLGQTFARQSGLTLLPPECLLNLYGKKTLIMHGDSLCSDDLAFQRYRRWVLNPLIQWLFLRLPLRCRLRIARRLRQKSHASQHYKSEQIMDVSARSVEERLTHYGVNMLIHGHTHRPAQHDLSVQGHPARRIVLGDWHSDRGSVLKVTPQGEQLIAFPLETCQTSDASATS
ncbi:MAG: UDP-2,3-diacylglucosamine diphosphatase [Enterobacteriaceae bacterium]